MSASDIEDTELMQMARRVSDVMNAYKAVPITPSNVDLRMIAELCWALGISPSIVISLEANTGER